MLRWLRQAAEAMHLAPPRPDDERRRKARLIERVKRVSDGAIAESYERLAGVGEEYQAIEIRVRR